MIQTHGRKGEDDLEDLVGDGKIITILTTWKRRVRTSEQTEFIEQNVQTDTEFLARRDSVQQYNPTCDQQTTDIQDVI